MFSLEVLRGLLQNITSVTAVAEAAGCDVRTVRRIRNGQIKNPGIDIAERVVAAARKYQKKPEAKPRRKGE